MNPNVLLTETELARYLRVSVRTLQLWRQKSIGPPSIKIGGVIRYRREAVITYLQDISSKPTC